MGERKKMKATAKRIRSRSVSLNPSQSRRGQQILRLVGPSDERKLIEEYFCEAGTFADRVRSVGHLSVSVLCHPALSKTAVMESQSAK
jgi:hypothetical protein